MEKIIPPVDANSAPGAIANLQSALEFLYAKGQFVPGLPGPIASAQELQTVFGAMALEKSPPVYGTATTRLVQHFQLQLGLGDSLHGQVEDSTAASLNQMLASLGAFDVQALAITGRVVTRTTQLPRPLPGILPGAPVAPRVPPVVDTPVARVRVAAYLDRWTQEQAIGEVVSAADGTFQFTLAVAAFRTITGTSTDALEPSITVRSLDGAGQVTGVCNRVALPVTSSLVDLQLAVTGLTVVTGQIDWIVRGRIEAKVRANQGMVIKAFDRDYSTRQLLGQCSTQLDGLYRIDYNLAAFRTGDITTPKKPWLIVEASVAADGPVLATSECRAARRDQQVDLYVDATSAADQWTETGTLLLPLLAGQGPVGSNLDPADVKLSGSELEFLTFESGISEARISTWCQARYQERDALSRPEAAGLPPNCLWRFLYAQGIAVGRTDWRFAQLSNENSWLRVLRDGVQVGAIAAFTDTEQAGLLIALSALKLADRLDPASPTASPAAHIIQIAAAHAEPFTQLGTVIYDIIERKGLSDTTIFDEFRATGASESQVSALRRGIDLMHITRGNGFAATALAKSIAADADHVRTLANWKSQDWLDFGTKTYGSASPQSEFNGYMMQSNFESMNPEVTFTTMFEVGGFVEVIPGYGADAKITHDVLVDFHNIGLTWDTSKHLVDAGITTPIKFTHYGTTALGRMLGDKVLPGVIDRIKLQIERRVAVGREVAISLGSNVHLPGPLRTGELEKIIGSPPPSIPGIFGDLGSTGCSHCESVLGLGAYFVDLMNLLRFVDSSGAGPSAYDVLVERRPDVYDLEISCRNSETELPHIDLVLDILESALGTGQQIAGTLNQLISLMPGHEISNAVVDAMVSTTTAPLDLNAFQVKSVPSRQTTARRQVTDGTRTWTFEQAAGATSITLVNVSLRHSALPDPDTEPRPRNPAAYRQLANQCYPWSLPYDDAWAECRASMAAAGIRRIDLMEAWADTTNEARAAERLGLSYLPTPAADGAIDEWHLICTPVIEPLGVLGAWGLGVAGDGKVHVEDPVSLEQLVVDWATAPDKRQVLDVVLCRVSILMNRTGLTLNQLQLLLETDFVNRQAPARLTLETGNQALTSHMRVAQLGFEHLDRMHRFVRLWRKLDWSIPALDAALSAAEPLDAAADDAAAQQLVKLADLQHLQLQIGVPVESLLGCGLPLWQVLPISSLGLARRTRTYGMDAVMLFEHDATKPKSSLYTSVFLPHGMPTSSRSGLELQGNSGEPKAAGQPISNLEDAIAFCLGIPERELKRALRPVGSADDGFTVEDVVTAKNLQCLYTYTTFAKAHNLTLSQLLVLVECIGIYPRSKAAHLGQLSDLHDALNCIESSHVRIEALPWLLLPASRARELATTSRGLMRTAMQTDGWLEKVRAGLNKLAIQSDQATVDWESDLHATFDLWMGEALVTRLFKSLQEAAAPGVFLVAPPNYQELVAAITGTTNGIDRWDAASNLRTAGLLTKADANRLLQAERNFSLEQRCTYLLERWQQVNLEIRLKELLAEDTGIDPGVAGSFFGWRLLIGGLPACDVFLSKAFLDSNDGAHSDALKTCRDWRCRIDLALYAVDLLQLGQRPYELLDQARLPSSTKPGVSLGDLIPPLEMLGTAWRPRWDDWKSLLDLAWLVQEDQLGIDVCAETLAALHEVVSDDVQGAPVALTQNHLTAFARRLTMQPTDAFDWVRQAYVTPPVARDLLSGSLLRRGYELASKARQLRISRRIYQALVTPTTSAHAAEAAGNILRSNLARNQLAQASAKIRDDMRTSQRDALVAALCHRRNTRTADDLYEYYLIDVSMSAGLKTTRLLQATNALQLFVQRILYGLEDSLTATEKVPTRWSWMRNYRVWEANRKVFLYPENWLYAEFREDKSPSFRQLESDLLKGDLNGNVAKEAFASYLNNLTNIAHIHVVGMFDDDPKPALSANPIREQQRRRSLYVVGRSVNLPYTYYWRVCTDFGCDQMRWSPWETIDLNIEGDHVVPFVMAGEFYLAWPRIKRPSPTTDHSAPRQPWEVTMSWSRHKDKAWEKARVMREPIKLFLSNLDDERSGIYTRAQCSPDKAEIDLYASIPIQDGQKNLPKQKPFDTASSEAVERLKRSAYLAFNLSKAGLTSTRSSSYYWSMVDRYSLSSALTVNWSCWIRAVGYDGNVAYFEISTNEEGRYTVHLSIQGTGQSHPWTVPLGTGAALLKFSTARRSGYIDPGSVANKYAAVSKTTLIKLENDTNNNGIDDSEIDISDAQSGNLEIYATLTCNGVVPYSSEPINVSPPTRDEFFRSSFVLCIEPTDKAGIPLSLETLGINRQRIHTRRATWSLTSPSRAEWNATPAPAGIPFFPIQSTPNDNGAVPKGEIEAFELPVTDPPARTVGSTPSLFAKDDTWTGSVHKYWAVAAASYLNSAAPSVWYYEEDDGQTGCILTTGSGDVGIFPTAFGEVEVLSNASMSTSSLLDPRRQHSSFGSENLPNLANRNSQIYLEAIRKGELTFSQSVPSAYYNWEIFLFAPLLVAERLIQQQQYEDADRWIRTIFDPVNGDAGNDARRFFHFRPFKGMDVHASVLVALKALASAAADEANKGGKEVTELKQLINDWAALPFRPWLIAGRRPLAYMWRVLFLYLDNLIAWADSLYRRFTRESLNEAMLLYVLAAKLLGERPTVVSGGNPPAAVTYGDLLGKWDDFANALINASGIRLGDGPSYPVGPADDDRDVGDLYFCVPANPKLAVYHDSIESRIFNMRHCRDIDGVARVPALTSPPIDPELLIRATAAGLSVPDIIAGVYDPVPPYRFQTLLARATELVSEVRSFGGALLSALEKKDGETVGLMRSRNELELQKLVRASKEKAMSEADANAKVLEIARQEQEANYVHYQHLLGHDGPKAPGVGESYADESLSGVPAVSGTGGDRSLALNSHEGWQLSDLGAASDWFDAAMGFNVGAAALHAVASVGWATPLIGDTQGKTVQSWAESASSVGRVWSDIASKYGANASNHALLGSHVRRRDEWAHASNSALKAITHIDRQAVAAKIRFEITKFDLEAHDRQVELSNDVDSYLQSKFTNDKLYNWMSSQLATLHQRAYQLAVDTAVKAERALQFELGRSDRFIGLSQWDGSRQGLLAGEALSSDLKRMELAYLQANTRELELTKHVSLLQLAPEQLVKLRLEGSCEFELTEDLFDLDYPGHYFRRLRNVSLSIPCVVGPYSTVNATLRLISHKVRTQNDPPDPELTPDYAVNQSIATSSAQNDSGMFEVNFRDERYLPFEGLGALSSWRLEFASPIRQFDHGTITDVILHLRYSARDAGPAGHIGVLNRLRVDRRNGRRLISVRRDFPAQWVQFAKATSDATSARPLSFTLAREHFPYWAGNNISLQSAIAYAIPVRPGVSAKADAGVAGNSDVRKKPDIASIKILRLTAVDGEVPVFDSLVPVSSDNAVADGAIPFSAVLNNSLTALVLGTESTLLLSAADNRGATIPGFQLDDLLLVLGWQGN